jgi:hypothetical protein
VRPLAPAAGCSSRPAWLRSSSFACRWDPCCSPPASKLPSCHSAASRAAPLTCMWPLHQRERCLNTFLTSSGASPSTR